jgi:D-psicose/D-tagatose/L-ribulose 3-epimerase
MTRPHALGLLNEFNPTDSRQGEAPVGEVLPAKLLKGSLRGSPEPSLMYGVKRLKSVYLEMLVDLRIKETAQYRARNQMKIGISAFAWTARFEQHHLSLLPAIKKMGVKGVEIPMFDPAMLPIASIRESFITLGLECTVCAILPKPFNPISSHLDTRKKSIEHLVCCVKAAAGMGARILGGPLFAPIGYLPKHRPSKAEWSWAVEAFQKLEDVLDANDMTLSIEPVNRSETFFLRTADEAKQLCESIGNPRIGVTVDTFHANIEERSIPEAIRSLGSHLKHVHASENDRGPLGRGHVPFKEIVLTLKEMGYTGYLMIEGFGYSAKEKVAPGKLWAHKDVSPEGLAAGGAQYLKQLLGESTL